MLLERLVIEGFLSYKNKQEVDLSKVSTCLVLGRLNDDPDLSNGAGKSSLFEVIPVNFFGKGSGRADLLDNYINDSMSKMYSEVIFKIDGQRFKTERTKARSAGTVFEIFHDTTNSDLDKATWKKTDKTIEEILGLSAKTYSSTIYLNERESLQIISGTSSERKEILRELLNIDIYEKASKVCNKNFDDYDRRTLVNLDLIKDKQKQLEQEDEEKQRLVTIEADLKMFKRTLKSQEQSLKESNETKKQIEISIETQKVIKDQIARQKKDFIELDKSKSKTENSLEDLTEELEQQKQKYSCYKKQLEAQVKEIPDLQTSILKIEDKIKKLDDVDKKLKDISKKLKTKREEKSKLQVDLNVTVTEAKPINQFLSRLEDFEAVCPVTELQCPVLKDDYKEDLKKEKNNELAKNAEKVTSLKEQVEKKSKEITEFDEKEEELQEQSETRQIENENLSKLKLKLQSIEDSQQKFVEKEKDFEEYQKNTEKQIIELKNEIKKTDKVIKEQKTKIEELETKIDIALISKLHAASEVIKDTESTISRTRNNLETKNQELGQVKSLLEKFEKMKFEIQHLSKNNEENTNKKRTYQTLSTVFGKDGIQKSIMKESIPLLEKYTAEFLKIFNDDSEKINVKFDLDPKRQDGELKKGGGLEILVLEEGKEPKDLQMYSGGETVRIVFSIVLSLAKLLSLRAGKKHETLIIDEKIAKLDVRGIAQFGEVINEISKIYKQVFVITHIETLKDMINGNEIIVNKTEEEGSLVTVS